MKKILLKSFASVCFLFAMFALATPANAAINWDVRGTYVWNVFDTYFHDFTIDTQDLNGNFTGHAGYPSGSAPYKQSGQTTETVTGTVTGDNIVFTVTYLGLYSPGSVFNMTGTIDSSGFISGNSPWKWSLDNHKALLDTDNDGVLDTEDLCLGSAVDGGWDESWGTNRWQYMDDNTHTAGWYQNKPAGKGKTLATYGHDLNYTYGCNGHQILYMLQNELGAVMNGHRKFGLSSSVLEEFHWDMIDGKLDGIYLVDEIDVPATSNAGINTTYTTVNGVNYKLEATETYRFANWGIYGIADAKFNYRDAAHGGPAWVDGSTWTAPYTNFLQVSTNVGGIDWVESYNASHLYTASFTGDGSPIHFQILDDAYGDNSGSIHVKIFADL